VSLFDGDRTVSDSLTGLPAARRLVQPLGTVLSHRDEILDSDAELVLEVDPRFDAEDHSRLKFTVVARRDVGRFVHLEADPVAGPMDEASP